MPSEPKEPGPGQAPGFAARIAAVTRRMSEKGIDAVLCAAGPELPWLIGYEAMPLERITMLVVRVGSDPVLVIPRLEAPRVIERSGLFSVLAWQEWEDPLDIVAAMLGSAERVAVTDRTWSSFLLGLQARAPKAAFSSAGGLFGPLRARKDAGELAALRAAGAQADQVALALLAGEIPLVGRTEAEVAGQISRLLLEAGHDRVNFAIVAAGPNGASPHHHPGSARIHVGDLVVCDFGGAVLWDSTPYCSDTTRTVAVGRATALQMEVHAVVEGARQAALAAAFAGTGCSSVDLAARSVIEEAGFGEYFVHRCGHGIGIEEHEAPYIAEGNHDLLEEGNVFSIEPGIYIPNSFGVRLEDIVALGASGPELLNNSPRDLVVL